MLLHKLLELPPWLHAIQIVTVFNTVTVRLLHTEFKQSNFQRIIIQRLIGQGFISKNAR